MRSTGTSLSKAIRQEGLDLPAIQEHKRGFISCIKLFLLPPEKNHLWGMLTTQEAGKGVSSLLCPSFFSFWLSSTGSWKFASSCCPDSAQQSISISRPSGVPAASTLHWGTSSKSFHYSQLGGNLNILEANFVLFTQVLRSFFILLTYYWDLQNILWILVD